MAHDDEYRAYREVIAVGIRLLRPHTEVRTAGPAEFGAELERFGPHVVVCGVPGRADPGDVLAWVESPAEVDGPARVRVGDYRRESPGLSLSGLLGVIDAAEELVRKKAGRAAEGRLPGSIHPTP